MTTTANVGSMKLVTIRIGTPRIKFTTLLAILRMRASTHLAVTQITVLARGGNVLGRRSRSSRLLSLNPLRSACTTLPASRLTHHGTCRTVLETLCHHVVLTIVTTIALLGQTSTNREEGVARNLRRHVGKYNESRSRENDDIPYSIGEKSLFSVIVNRYLQ